ncbi:MAG: TerC/Alx family metal homeostasis membrane protein [Actinomycetaceae bacterium]|nr:TerC/Alx family metal homeostasis membrane protein [Actinomycetaceae bacterium]
MQVGMWEWLALGVLVVGLIGADLVLHLRRPHEPTLRECTGWLAFYVGLAVVFGLYTIFRHSTEFGVEYFSTYFTEYSLSIDNIFIFIIIIGSFRVPRKYQQKVLLWGIVIALVLRLIFILLGAALLQRFSWLFFLFAAFLLWTAWSQVREGVQEESKDTEEEEYEPNGLVRAAEKVFKVTDGFVGDKMVVRRAHKTYITPFLLCILAIGSADLMFALDSIPASFGLTSQPFIIFAANAFALMGLRQLFFLVDGLLEKLVYLHYGLAAILGFIGVKLLIEACHGQGWLHSVPAIAPLVSLGVIVAVLLVTVVASLVVSRRR